MNKNNHHLNPHDRCFRTLMQNPKVANEFFAKHLPEAIKKQVDFDTLELQKESHISPVIFICWLNISLNQKN